jgi:hypothetical protein
VTEANGCRLVAVDVKKPTDNLRSPNCIDSLNVDLDEFGEIKIKDEAMDEVEAITDDDEWELVEELGFFKEVFDLLWIVKVTLATDALHLANLTSTSGDLDVLEINFRFLAVIDH